MSDLIYGIPDGRGQLTFTEAALDHMFTRRQNRCLSKESGGQLFASFDEGKVIIVEATGPKRQDMRGRFSFWPHRPSEQKEISQRYREAGLHFVGDWHTHPERIPHPSNGDVNSVARMFSASNHDIFGILLVVVGTENLPNGLYVGLYDESGLKELTVIDEQAV